MWSILYGYVLCAVTYLRRPHLSTLVQYDPRALRNRSPRNGMWQRIRNIQSVRSVSLHLLSFIPNIRLQRRDPRSANRRTSRSPQPDAGSPHKRRGVLLCGVPSVPTGSGVGEGCCCCECEWDATSQGVYAGSGSNAGAGARRARIVEATGGGWMRYTELQRKARIASAVSSIVLCLDV